MNLTTDAELAQEFGLDLRKFTELRRKHRWPHIRLGRFEIRFTEEQVAEIIRQHTAISEKPADIAQRTSGQTARSARRSS